MDMLPNTRSTECIAVFKVQSPHSSLFVGLSEKHCTAAFITEVSLYCDIILSHHYEKKKEKISSTSISLQCPSIFSEDLVVLE